MASKKFSSAPKSEREEIFDALLGPPEEMDEESADAFLETYDIDPTQLVSELKECISRESRKLRVAGREAPPTMQNALRDLREYERRRSTPPLVDPAIWIGNLLNSDLGGTGRTEVVYSFHKRKGDLSESDQAVLDALKAELADETDDEN